MESANFKKLSSMHFYAWKKGLKTGTYYLRTKAATDAIKFTIEQSVIAQFKTAGLPNTEVTIGASTIGIAEKIDLSSFDTAIDLEPKSCSIDNPDCESCSG